MPTDALVIGPDIVLSRADALDDQALHGIGFLADHLGRVLQNVSAVRLLSGLGGQVVLEQLGQAEVLLRRLEWTVIRRLDDAAPRLRDVIPRLLTLRLRFNRAISEAELAFTIETT